MAQKLRFLVVLCLGWLFADVSAQNLIFYQNTQSQAYLFKQGGGGQSAAMVDYFIQKIAAGNNKPSSRTEYILVHDDIIRLTKVGPYQFDVSVNLGAFRLNGDTQYRGFSLEQQLVPGAVKFRLEHRTKQGQVRQGWDFDVVNFSGDPSTIAAFRATDSTGQFTNDIVAVADKQFIYNDASRQAFEQRVELIDGYFRDATALPALKTELTQIDPMQLESIDTQEGNLNRAKAKVDAIRQKNYPANLGINSKIDPAGFLMPFQQLEALLAEKQTKMNDVKSRLHQYYHERGLASVQANKPALAKADFQKAIQIQPNFAPSHIELARISYAEGNAQEAVNKLQYVFKDLRMDEPTRASGRQLANTIYQNHLGNYNYAYTKGEYDRALSELDLAKNLCTRITDVPCDNNLETGYQRVHRAVYTNIVRDGVKLETEKNFIGAEEKGVAALAYQQKNNTYVTTAPEALELLKRVRKARYDGMVAKADALIKESKLDEAEAAAREAITYQNGNPTELGQATEGKAALDKVMGLKYKQWITKGDASIKAKDFRSGLTQLESAKALENDHVFAKDTSLTSKIKVCAKATMLEDGQQGLDLVKQNRLQDARAITTKFNEMVDRYGLGSHTAIQKMKGELQAAIFSQECTNATNEYNRILQVAEQKRSLKLYLDANEQWSLAIKHAEENKACQIDVVQAVSQKTAHSKAVIYLEMVNQATDQYKNTNHSGAVTTYQNAGDMFYKNDLDAGFGLTHKTLKDFAMDSKDKELMLAAANHYVEKQELNEALELVYKLATSGYPVKRLKVIQTRLGKELAIRDKQADPGADPKVKAATYSRAQSTMKVLSKSYLKQWKSM